MSGVIRAISSRALTLVRPATSQKATLVSGPPRHRVSMQEKSIIGVVMCTIVCAPAAWIMSHIEDYKKRADAED